MMPEKPRVLFLCTGNSCRSQMAEGMLRHYAGNRFDACSAGTLPKDQVHPRAVEVMHELGIDISGQIPEHVDRYLGRVPVEYAIITCDGANETCPAAAAGMRHRLFWPFDDPAGFVGSADETRTEFRRVRDQIRIQLLEWLLHISEGERCAAEERHLRLLEQLGDAAHVNTMGEIASGLAHELNQPLGAVSNYIGGCLERLDSGAPVDELRGVLEKAHAATLRAGEIVRRLRRFATRQEHEEAEIDPSRLLAEATEFLRDEALRREVALEIDPAPDLPPVRGDAVLLQQVLVNLLRNALDAIAAAKPKNPAVLAGVARAPEGGVEFRVIDNGDGLPTENREHVFDPFFSTRAEGMGMGLAISRSIVEAHGGRMSAESEPGAGTTFRFLLPAVG